MSVLNEAGLAGPGPGAVSAALSDEEKRRVAFCLTRSLVAEGISYDLIVTLDEVLSYWPVSAPRTRRFDGLLVRVGLPPRPQRLPDVATLSDEDAARFIDRFRRATQILLQVAPYRAETYPTRELSLLVALRDGHAPPGGALPYLRRWALAILAVLDLMGDDE
ncbi:hypothetical protein [Streptomyces sp. NPDC008125]|uniref:hypothetical protein n=1 Tax=Streptomyces sp. NPDC008125 TaxID=3364811 RepID=UPI0036E0C398